MCSICASKDLWVDSWESITPLETLFMLSRGLKKIPLTTSETANARKWLLRLPSEPLWRILTFYSLPMLLIGSVVLFNEYQLLDSKGTVVSPFVISSSSLSSIKVISHAIDDTVVTASLSCGNCELCPLPVCLEKNEHALRVFTRISRFKIS